MANIVEMLVSNVRVLEMDRLTWVRGWVVAQVIFYTG